MCLSKEQPKLHTHSWTLKIPFFGWDSFEICAPTLAHLPKKKTGQTSPFSSDDPHCPCRILAQLHASQVKCTQELLRLSMFSSCEELHVKIKVSSECKQMRQQKYNASLERSMQLPHVGPGAARPARRDVTQLWNPGLEFAPGYVTANSGVPGWHSPCGWATVYLP